MRNISNSEVQAWLSCRKMFKYAFRLNLTPNILSDPLAGGTLGHEAFQRYVEERLEGHTHEKAMIAGESVFTQAIQTNTVRLDLVMKIAGLWRRYMIAQNGWPQWKLIGTEQRFDLQLTPDFSMPIRYDMELQDIVSGKNYVLDFKFTYDFWRPNDHNLNGQLPKYIFVLNMHGRNIHGGILEEIRTRPLGPEKSSDSKNLWKRTMYNPSLIKKQMFMKQHIAASIEIDNYFNADSETQSNTEIGVYNKFGACKMCNFVDLCTSELEGNTDLTYFIESAYRQNDYGYNQNVIEMETEL